MLIAPVSPVSSYWPMKNLNDGAAEVRASDAAAGENASPTVAVETVPDKFRLAADGVSEILCFSAGIVPLSVSDPTVGTIALS
jgi:hypothetical protein